MTDDTDLKSIIDRPETQGQRKMTKRLKYLFSNKFFLEELDGILAITNPKKRNKRIWKFAKEYSLEYAGGSPLVAYLSNKMMNLEGSINFEDDVCVVQDQMDLYLNDVFPVDFDTPPSRHPQRQHEIENYPIHICISPFASQRDVLDFVKKRWEQVRYELDMYGEKTYPIRKKKKKKRDDLIWKHKNKPRKEIASIVNKALPKENLIYSDISSILYYLKKDRD